MTERVRQPAQTDAETVARALEHANEFRSDGNDRRYEDALSALGRIVAERDRFQEALERIANPNLSGMRPSEMLIFCEASDWAKAVLSERDDSEQDKG